MTVLTKSARFHSKHTMISLIELNASSLKVLVERSFRLLMHTNATSGFTMIDETIRNKWYQAKMVVKIDTKKLFSAPDIFFSFLRFILFQIIYRLKIKKLIKKHFVFKGIYSLFFSYINRCVSKNISIKFFLIKNNFSVRKCE